LSQITNNPSAGQAPIAPTSTQQADPSIGDRASTAAGAAKDQAGAVADTARSQVSEVTTAATEQARAVAADAKQQARRLVDESRSQLRTQATEQTSKLAGSVREISQQLQGVSQGGTPPEGIVADIVEQAAGVTSRFAQQLESRSPEELLDDVKRFARRRPGLFLLGALGAGFAAGRVIRTVDTTSIVDSAKQAVSGQDESSGNGFESQGGFGATTQMPVGSPGALGTTGTASTGAGFPDELAPAVRP